MKHVLEEEKKMIGMDYIVDVAYETFLINTGLESTESNSWND